MFSKIITGNYYKGVIGIFSLLATIGVLSIMDRWFKRFNIEHNPFVSNLMLLTTVIFMVSAIVVRMDMLMTYFIVLSLYTFFKIYKGENKESDKCLLPVYIFLAVFTKGPIGILIPLLSILTFLIMKGKIRSFGIYLGWKQWLILTVLFVVWFSGVLIEGGSEYLYNLVIKQTIGRGFNSFHHKESFWYYFPRILWSFAPWILLYVVLIVQGIRAKFYKTDVQLFFLTTIVVNILMFSLISSKLDIYLLPLYPFVVYLCSSILIITKKGFFIRAGVFIPAFILALLFPVFMLYKNSLPYKVDGIIPYLGLGMLSICSIIGIRMIFRNKFNNALLCIGYGLLVFCFVISFAIPQINQYIGFKELALKAREVAKENGIEEYYFYKIKGASNMEIYLGKELIKARSIQMLDSIDNQPQKCILFVETQKIYKDKELENMVVDKTFSKVVGNYSCYILGDVE